MNNCYTRLTAIFFGTTRVSQYQKGKTNLDVIGARDSEWQWHQLGHMQVCTSIQTDNHASTSPLSFFTGRMPFLPTNQQRQSTEGIIQLDEIIIKCTPGHKTTCDCVQQQTINHIVNMCPLTKFDGGLNLLHETDDDAVIWLESTVTATHAK